MTNSCGNPNDTGQQLMAANIGYDNTITQLAAAHVQAAIDILANQTGLNYHPNFTGRELDDQHPQSAITDLINDLAGKAPTSHTQPATTVTYDNTAVNLLGSIEAQGALDELATLQSAGVLEYAALAIEVVLAEGIAASVNQMDWTGHPHADATVPTALRVQTNHIVTFGNGTDVAYRWVGPKPALLGLGSGTVSTDDDYLPVGTADHAILVNRNQPDQHTIAAVTDLQSELDGKTEEAPNDGLQYGRQSGTWTEIITDSAGILTGYKNILINPLQNVNQRGFDNNWPILVDGVYGFDRWFKFDGTHKAQRVEDANLEFGILYTLTWEGGGDGTVSNSGGSFTGPSPLVGVITNGSVNDTECRVPFASTKMQLEQGDITDGVGAYNGNFEIRHIGLEKLLCQRYYFKAQNPASSYSYKYGLAGTQRPFGTIPFPAEMRVQPTVNILSEPSYANCSDVDVYGGPSSPYVHAEIRGTITSSGTYRAAGGLYEFVAEL